MKLSSSKILILLIFISAQFAYTDDFEKSVVQVVATYQEFNPFKPWQKWKPCVRYGYGVAISKSQVITTESIIRNHTLVELRRSGSGKKINAKVELCDYQSNLALLTITDTNEAPWITPLSLAQDVPAESEVEIIQFGETFKIQQGKAKMFQIAMKYLPKAPHVSLTFSVLTDLNVNGMGAAVIYDSKLAGLVIRYNRSTRTGDVLPYCVLNRFIKDAEKKPYEGIASAGFTWSTLIDPVKRSYFGVGKDEVGILVLSCLPETGARESLKPLDVILSLDGHAIDNLGYYKDEKFGRLMFTYLINGRHKPGDTVSVQLMRNKKIQNIKIQLDHLLDSDSFIPDNTEGKQPEYLVEGGLVIRELTGKYLKSFGENWRSKADSELVHLYLTRKKSLNAAGDRIVILSSVLSDPINIGYQYFYSSIITHINGKKIQNMSDVFGIVDRDGSIERLTLKSIGVDLVLDTETLAEANARLSERYRVPKLRYQNVSQK
ncbi:PDZ domain-containing protein [Verrucomicrobiota bacterium]